MLVGSGCGGTRGFGLGLGSSGSDHHNFYVFDLTGINQPVLGATLKLHNPSTGYGSPDPTENYSLFDVSTPIDLLSTMITPQNPAVLVRDFKTDKTFIITRSDLIRVL